MGEISIELKKTMASNIDRQLKIAKKTQREMCQALGFKENTVSDWMNAKTYPRIDKIEMMANYFNCKKSNLIERLSDQLGDSLTIQEQQLLSDFRAIEESERVQALDFVRYLAEKTKKRKDTSA